MIRNRIRTTAAIAGVACALGAGAFPAPASAATLLDSLVGQLTTTLLTPLQALKPGRAGEQLLCPTVGQLGGPFQDIPGLGELFGGITLGACNLSVLDYDWRVEIPQGPGDPPKVMVFSGILNVPTYMNIDDDPGPDIAGNIRALSTEIITVEILRVGDTELLPAKVEAIIPDPSRGSLPREEIAFGYDATDSGVPNEWRTDLRLEDVFGDPDPVKLGIDIFNGGAPGPLAATAELYDRGPAGARVDPIGGSLKFDPPPTRVTADLSLGSRIAARVRSSKKSRLTGEMHVVDGNDKTEGTAVIDELPELVDIAFQKDADGHPRIDYDATDTIQRVSAHFAQRTGAPAFNDVTTQANVNVLDVPRGFTVIQTADKSARFTTRGGRIGEINGNIALNGDPLPTTTGGDFLELHQEGDFLSANFRLIGVEFAEFDGSDPIQLNAKIAPGPFVANVHTEDLDVDASVNNLPSNLRLLIDTGDDMRLAYDGSDGIDELSVDMRSAEPLFDRATQLHAEVDDIPEQLQVDASTAGPNIELRADNEIGAIELSANNGQGESLPVGQQGVIYRDLPSQFAVFGRLNGFEEFTFQPEPIAAHIEAGDGGSFSMNASIRQAGAPLNVAGLISNLPRSIDVLVDDGDAGTHVLFDASEPVSNITFDANGLTLLDRADNMHAQVAGLPDRLEINMPETGPLFSASASQPIGTLTMQLADGGFEQLAPGRDGLIYLDTLDRFAVTGQISGLRGASVSDDPIDVSLDIPAAPVPFDFSVRRQEFTDDTADFFQGTIDRPRRDTHIQVQTEPETHLAYSAGDPIDLITLASNVGSIGLIDVSLANLPRFLNVCMDSADEDQSGNITNDGSGCRRPSSPDRSGDIILSADINDAQSAHGNAVLNGQICPDPDNEAACRAGQGTQIHLNNLSVRNLAADVNDDGVDSSAFIDTDNHSVTGEFTLQTDSVGFRYNTPSPGLRAQDRMASAFDSSGTISCPPGTFIGLTDPIELDLSGLLCP